MQDNKCCPYSFYVPAKDKQLCDFLESQSNLSMSIRLLLKAFIANYDQEYPDVTVMDLRELMESMVVNPEEVLQGVVAEKKSVSVVKSMKPVPEPEKVISLSEDTKPETEEDQDEAQDELQTEETAVETAEVKPTEASESSEEVDETDETEETNDEEDDDFTPNIVVEQEKPQKLNGSARDAYNNSQNAEENASEDDILAMMGGM